MLPSRDISIVITILFLIGLQSVSYSQNQSAEVLIRTANELIENQEYNKAIAKLNKVSIKNSAPNEIAEVYLAFAMIAFKKNDNENLSYYLSKAQEVTQKLDNSTELRNKISLLKLRILSFENPKKAIREWKNFIDTNSNHYDTNYTKALVGIGSCYTLLQLYDSALQQFNMALQNPNKLNDNELTNLYQNKAFVLTKLNISDSVLILLNESIKRARLLKNIELELDGLSLIAAYYVKNNNLEEAKLFLDSAAIRANKSELLKTRYFIATFYTDYYIAKKEFEQALFWLKRAGELKDSLSSHNIELRLDLFESARRIEFQEIQIKKNRTTTIVVIIGLALSLLIAFSQFRLIRARNKVNRKLTEQNIYIHNSKSKIEGYLNKIEELAKKTNLNTNNLDYIFELICLTAQETLNVSRVSLWLFNQNHDSLKCIKLCIDQNIEETDTILTIEKYPRYFETLKSEGQIVASDAHTHYGTSEFAIGYLDTLEIKSMVDTPIILSKGEFYGVICCEQTHSYKNWEAADVIFLRSLCSFISIAILSNEITNKNELLLNYNSDLEKKNNEIGAMNHELNALNEELVTMNDSLEETVMNRTKELETQNAQLTEYAFINSHLLRAPLARILGLSKLMTMDEASIKDVQLLNALITSTNELDEIIKKISDILYDGNNLTREDIKSIIDKNFRNTN